MLRTKAAKLHSDSIAWRSHEPSRLETFSDAVFAFALTLIIVSIEVPKTFDELYETMKGTISFAICFTVLFHIWNLQNIFFRRFALKDNFTLVLNAILLFFVLIYAYPLKFLSVLIFADQESKHLMIRTDQVRELMLVYGAGFLVIHLLFYLMYRNAKKFALQIGLTAPELFETATLSGINLICVFVCILAMTVTCLVPPNFYGFSGFMYFLIPVAYSTWFSYRGKKKRRTFGDAPIVG